MPVRGTGLRAARGFVTLSQVQQNCEALAKALQENFPVVSSKEAEGKPCHVSHAVLCSCLVAVMLAAAEEQLSTHLDEQKHVRAGRPCSRQLLSHQLPESGRERVFCWANDLKATSVFTPTMPHAAAFPSAETSLS